MQTYLMVLNDDDIDDLSAEVGQIPNGSDVVIDLTGYVSENVDAKPLDMVEDVTFAVRYASYVDDKQFHSITLDGVPVFSPKCARNISWTLIDVIHLNFLDRSYLDSESRQILQRQFKEVFVDGSMIKGIDQGDNADNG